MAVNLQEAHYCGLFSQSNVYGLSDVCLPGGKNKLLVASLRGKVMSMEFQNTRPLAKEVHFTYIPADAEIVSIDAFKKSSYGNGVVIGISFIKTTENKPCQFLNIYSAWEPDSEYDLESIAQGCQNLELDFVPYQLSHAQLFSSNSSETVFLLAGSDLKVHMYREDRQKHTFSAESSDPYFPEFRDLAHTVSYFDCKTCANNRRITALGCQNGLVKFFVVDAENAEILQQYSIQHDNMITSAELFNLESNIQAPVFVKEVLETEEEGSEETSIPEWHLVVVSALEVSVVYRNVEQSGFSDPLVLADSERYDSALCCHVTDVDLDGENEILIGTYGQELLVYKYERPKTKIDVQTIKSSEYDLNAKPSDENLARRQSLISKAGLGHGDGDYQLIWQRSFPKPILALDDLDITSDGLQEIVVLTLSGLHVLQHDLNYVSSLCQKRLKQFAKLQHQGDVFQQLLQESL